MNKYIPIYIIVGGLVLSGCMKYNRSITDMPSGPQPMVTDSNPIVLKRTGPRVRTKPRRGFWGDTRLNTQTYYGTSRTPPKN